MHPREAYHQRTGTGRLAALALEDAEILIGVNFSANERLAELISGKNGAEGYGEGRNYHPVMLYPGKEALFSDSPEFRAQAAGRRLLIILVDATWNHAAKIVKLSTCLKELPTLSFNAQYRSQFSFKRQPAPECLSTIESVFYLTGELQKAGLANTNADISPLMRVFHAMIEYQLACEQERQMSGYLGQTTKRGRGGVEPTEG